MTHFQRDFRTNQHRGMQGELYANALLGDHHDLMVYRPEHFGSYDDSGVDLIVRNRSSREIFTVSVKTVRFKQLKKVKALDITRIHMKEYDNFCAKKAKCHDHFLCKTHVMMVILQSDLAEESNFSSLTYFNVPLKGFILFFFNGEELRSFFDHDLFPYHMQKMTRRYTMRLRIYEDGENGNFSIGQNNNLYSIELNKNGHDKAPYLNNFDVFEPKYNSVLASEDLIEKSC